MFETPEDRLTEVQLYELVAEEIENNQQSKGLWAKAIADSEGTHEKAKALYIKLRVQMIKDEWAYADKVATEEAKQVSEAARQQKEFHKQKQREARRTSEREKARGMTTEKDWKEYMKNTTPDRVPLYMMLVTLGILILGIATLS